MAVEPCRKVAPPKRRELPKALFLVRTGLFGLLSWPFLYCCRKPCRQSVGLELSITLSKDTLLNFKLFQKVAILLFKNQKSLQSIEANSCFTFKVSNYIRVERYIRTEVLL
jgi:hypothetical protein